MQSSFKIIIIVLAVGVLSTGAYFAMENKANGQSEPLLTSEVTNNAITIPQGNTSTDETIQTVLRQINDLDNIKLNTDIFDKPEFLALKDISQELPEPTDIGRPNPFAPIGVDVGVISSDEGMPIETGSATGANGFDTQDPNTPISQVRTKEVQNVGQRSATINGETVIPGSTNRWFEWGTNQNTVNKTAKQTGAEATYTATLTGLSPRTTYYIKAAVEQNGGTVYGELILFKTAE